MPARSEQWYQRYLRRGLVMALAILGGVVGAFLGWWAGFIGTFAVCWCISRVFGEEYMHLMWFGIPITMILACAGALTGGGVVIAVYVARRMRKPGVCHQCGYDLRATPDCCPECGERVVQPGQC